MFGYVDGYVYYNYRVRVREAFFRVSGGVGDVIFRIYFVVLI